MSAEKEDEKKSKKAKVPIPGQRNILITSALPYVNNVPHLGNIIGCVLSADVYARFCRLRGYNTLYICGTDEYGTATETKAIQEQTTPQQLCDKYHKLHREIYDWFDIQFDHFGRTTTPQQTAIAQDIFKRCDENKYLVQKSIQQLFCVTCDRFLADRYVKGRCPVSTCGNIDARGDQCDKCGTLIDAVDLVDPCCLICRSQPIKKTSDHLFLSLDGLSKELQETLLPSSTKGKWSANSIQITNAWFRKGLEPRCITRDLKWGTVVPKAGFENKVFYVWFDAPIGYISITAQYTAQWQLWWKNRNDVQLYQFMGKDNIAFHTILFPATLLATHEPYIVPHHINACEYLNYESGKFSKSRGSGVFGDDAMKSGIACEVWRYYLLATRPETSDSTFQWDHFVTLNNNELLANFGNYVHRSLSFIKRSLNGVCVTPSFNDESLESVDARYISDINSCLEIYRQNMEDVKLKDALKAVMKISALGNAYTQRTQPWTLVKSGSKCDMERCKIIVFYTLKTIAWLAILVNPFMPSVSHKICQQLRVNTDFTQALSGTKFEFLDFKPFVDSQHTIGEPIPIFRRIEKNEYETLKGKFVGN